MIKALTMLVGIVVMTQACYYIDKIGGKAELLDRLHEKRLEVGRALLEVTSGGVDDVLPYYSHDIEYHDPIVDIYGIDHMTGFLNQLIEDSSPDLRTIVVDETLIDDIYSATWIMDGSFNGIPYEAKGISIFKFRPNSFQVYYQRDYYSEGDIMATIDGMDELMAVFRAQYRCAVDPTFDCPFPPASSVGQLKSSKKLKKEQLSVGRQLVEMHAGNWTEVLPFLADDYEYHDPIVDIVGPETMAQFLARLFAGSSNLYTVIEDETLVNDIYMSTWTMTGSFNGAEFSAPGMSIVKFVEGTSDVYYSRDYYSEGDIMLGISELTDAVKGFRHYYLCAVDPEYDCPSAP